MQIPVNLGDNPYNIFVEKGILEKAGEYLHLDRRVLVVTDTGVPSAYSEAVARQCGLAVRITVEQGEGAKCFAVLERLLATMLENHFSRKDCIVAVGGGVVGDLAGFAASMYMRGIAFYNIPTTLLSQVDSSIGGKTAVNFGGVKNIVGAFYQPKTVLIDPLLLQSLPQRQMANGLAEAIKMAITCDQDLFALLETGDIQKNLDTILVRSLQIKKSIVEQDEKEAGVRSVLNFGHTIGHGMESCGGLYHGECVALGMLPMCAEEVRPRLLAVLQKYGLYRKIRYDWEKIAAAAFHDKKADGDTVSVTMVDSVGTFVFRKMKCADVIARAKDCLEGGGV